MFASSFSFFVPIVSYFLFCVPCSAKSLIEHEMRQNDGKTPSLHRLRGRGTASAVGGAFFAHFALILLALVNMLHRIKKPRRKTLFGDVRKYKKIFAGLGILTQKIIFKAAHY